VITVDGQPVHPGPANAHDDDGDSREEALRTVRLELKLCKALAALNPPHEVSASLHARITDLLRRLKRHDATDQDVTQAADLSDDELHQAAKILRAFRALPTWEAAYQGGGTGFRTALGSYAMGLADELDKRATQDSPPGCLAYPRGGQET
jgi:hypothetical protein